MMKLPIEVIVTTGGGAAWGGITGTLSTQADLQAALDAKQATLVSATNIKTVNGTTLLGVGDLAIAANATHTGDVTGATALTIAANAVTLSKMAQLATSTILGRVTAATGNVEALTGAQVTTLIDTFVASGASGKKGLVPDPGVTAGTTKFLREDATWAAPAGGGDMVLSSAQTNTGLKTYNDATLGLRNVANTFTAQFTNAITAARTYTLKDASGTVAFTSDITGVNSGTNTGDQTITLTSDVTGTGVGSFATTIAAGVVSNAKLATVGTSTFKGRITAATGAPEDLTVAQAKTVLAYTPADIGAATTAQANATHTGEVTGATALTITADAVDNTKLANMVTQTFKGRNTAATGDPEDLSVATAKTMLNLTGTNSGDQTITLTGPVTGTGAGSFATTIAAGVVTLANQADMATASVVYRKTAATGAPEVQTLATLKTDLGLTGTNGGDQTITLTGDVTGTGTGSFAATIAADVVTNAKLANMATATFKGRATAATGDPEDLTGTQATTLLDLATVALKGLAPVRSGVSTEYLSGTGVYSTPAGGGGVTDGDKGDITVSGTGAAWAVDPNIKYGLPIALQCNVYFN